MKREEHHRLVIDGNAFYELDLDCVHRKQEEKSGQRKRSGKELRKNNGTGDQK
jgi:hypothetical protein